MKKRFESLNYTADVVIVIGLLIIAVALAIPLYNLFVRLPAATRPASLLAPEALNALIQAAFGIVVGVLVILVSLMAKVLIALEENSRKTTDLLRQMLAQQEVRAPWLE